MRITILTISLLATAGCAFPQQVQRFGVEYNTALANMQNEQTLLNLLRARDGMPTHFTSVSQFRGSISLQGGGSLNAQLRGAGLAQTESSGATLSDAVTNSATTGLTNPQALPSSTIVASTVTTTGSSSSLVSAVAEGVDLYTPQITGQIASGTNFDVSVFDTQKFYQGILGDIPFTTVEGFLNQGIDDKLLMHMLVARVDFRLQEDVPGYGKKGKLILSASNTLANLDEHEKFSNFVLCNRLSRRFIDRSAKDIAAMSRFTQNVSGTDMPLAIDKFTAIDWKTFELSEGLTASPKDDSGITLRRIEPERRAAGLDVRTPFCTVDGQKRQTFKFQDQSSREVNVPSEPDKDPVYVGDFTALVYANGKIQEVLVDIEFIFKSTEGVFRHLGQSLSKAGMTNQNARLINICESEDKVCIGDNPPLAKAVHNGQTFYLVNFSKEDTRSAEVFTIIQQLVNLHKEAGDRPISIPVRAVP